MNRTKNRVSYSLNEKKPKVEKHLLNQETASPVRLVVLIVIRVKKSEKTIQVTRNTSLNALMVLVLQQRGSSLTAVIELDVAP